MVNVFGNHHAVVDSQLANHGRNAFSEFVPGDEGPKDPVDDDGGDDSDYDGTASGPGDVEGGLVLGAHGYAQGDNCKGEQSDEAGARMV